MRRFVRSRIRFRGVGRYRYRYRNLRCVASISIAIAIQIAIAIASRHSRNLSPLQGSRKGLCLFLGLAPQAKYLSRLRRSIVCPISENSNIRCDKLKPNS